MKKNNSFLEIYEKLKSSENILLCLHANPDGDSLGSSSALKYFIEKKLKKNAKIISYYNLPENLTGFFFSEIDSRTDITDINLKNFDLLVILDTASEDLIGKLKENYKLPRDIFIINIDHHKTNTYFGDMNCVFPEKSSACSVLLDFFEDIGEKIDKQMATMLLLGVCTDSVFFKIKNAGSALKDACRLIRYGGDYEMIIKKSLFSDRIEMKRFFALIIDNFKIVRDKNFGYSVISYPELKKLGISNSEARAGIFEITTIKDMDFVFLIIEFENAIKVSFRSAKGIDVSNIAKALGGGGHKSAAGVYLKKMPLEKAEKLVIDKIKGLA